MNIRGETAFKDNNNFNLTSTVCRQPHPAALAGRTGGGAGRGGHQGSEISTISILSVIIKGSVNLTEYIGAELGFNLDKEANTLALVFR